MHRLHASRQNAESLQSKTLSFVPQNLGDYKACVCVGDADRPQRGFAQRAGGDKRLEHKVRALARPACFSRLLVTAFRYGMHRLLVAVNRRTTLIP